MADSVLRQHLRCFAERIDRLNRCIGAISAALIIGLVLLQFLIVLLRYVLAVGSVQLQELLVFVHAAALILATGDTLRKDGHVRCDVLYARVSDRGKAWIDLLGCVVFLWPMCALIAGLAWPYVVSSWAVLEGSAQGSMGLPGVFLLKSLLLVFPLLLALQGLSLSIRAVELLSR